MCSEFGPGWSGMYNSRRWYQYCPAPGLPREVWRAVSAKRSTGPSGGGVGETAVEIAVLRGATVSVPPLAGEGDDPCGTASITTAATAAAAIPPMTAGHLRRRRVLAV